MSNAEFTPSISTETAFKRDPTSNSAERLVYPNLVTVVDEAEKTESALWREFNATKEGTVDEEDRARALARGYVVRTALQLQRTDVKNQKTISDRFTTSATELWGTPDEAETKRIIGVKVSEFESYKSNPNVDQERLQKVLDFYGPQTHSQETTTETDPAIAKAAKELLGAVERKFHSALEVFEDIDPEGADVKTEDAITYFQQGLDKLAEQDPTWKEWKIKVSEDSASMASNAKEKQVTIGRKRKDFKPREVKAKFIHEFLVHTARTVNGSKTSDRMMEHGLPNFLDGEEGVTTLLEFAILGEPGPARTDKYSDFAFALGLVGDKPVTRAELHDFYVNRAIVRLQATGKQVDEEKIKDTGWKTINRMYKGSLGNDVVGVNTVDLAYHNGFVKVGRYIEQALNSGKTADQLLVFLLKGKFDPTNDRHVHYVSQF